MSAGVLRMESLAHHQTLAIGSAIVLVVVLAVVLGPVVSPFGPNEMDFLQLLAAPSWKHWFGTDSFGRDVLVRVLHGARISLIVSLTGVSIAALAGTLLGMTAAMVSGLFDALAMRFVDLLLAMPSFVLALFLMLTFGFGLPNVILAIGLIYLPNFARLARNTTLTLKGEPYVQAAHLMGQSRLRIMVHEILPNIAAPLFVQLSTALAFGILVEAGLSFLGLGVQPPTPSLGIIMSDGKEYFQRGPWVLTLTGLTTTFIILGLNLLSDGVRDLLDPKLRRGFGQ